jgi:hypothetical protein
MRSSCAAASSSAWRVPSVLPSSTSTISCGPPGSASSTPPTRRSSSESPDSSLCRGIAIEILVDELMSGRAP